MIDFERLYLTLEQRVAAVKLLDQGKSAQSIADQFGCGKTQILVIIFLFSTAAFCKF